MPTVPARRAGLVALALIPMLSACGTPGGGTVQSASTSTRVRPAIRKPVTGPPPAARIHMMPGLEGVIGATTSQLVREFGTPRLDVWEGEARKLQYRGSACVLDIYLYPSTQGREPQATYVEARRASDGQAVDRAACVRALRLR